MQSGKARSTHLDKKVQNLDDFCWAIIVAGPRHLFGLSPGGMIRLLGDVRLGGRRRGGSEEGVLLGGIIQTTLRKQGVGAGWLLVSGNRMGPIRSLATRAQWARGAHRGCDPSHETAWP